MLNTERKTGEGAQVIRDDVGVDDLHRAGLLEWWVAADWGTDRKRLTGAKLNNIDFLKVN